MAILTLIFLLALLSPTLTLLFPLFFTATPLALLWGQELLFLLGQTAIVSLGALVVALALGLGPGFLLGKTDLPGRRFFLILACAGASLPIHVQGGAWLALLGRAGLLAPWWQQVWPSFSLYTAWGAAWIMGVAYAPLVTLLMALSVRQLDSAAEEEASTYLSPLAVWFYVTLRQAKVIMAMIALVVIVLSLGEITVTDMLGVSTLAEKIYWLLMIDYRPAMATAMSLPLLILTVLWAIALGFLGRRHWQATNSPTPKISWRFSLGAYRGPAFLLACAGLLPLLPIAALLPITGSVSFCWKTALSLREETVYSLQVAMGTALLTTLAALFLSRRILTSRLSAWSVGLLLLWLVVVPPPLTGIGLLRFFNFVVELPFVGPLAEWLRDTPLVLIWAMTLRFLPFAVAVILPILRRIPPAFEEAATLEGCTVWQRFWFVLFPKTRLSLLLSFCVVAILALGELGTTVLVVPPGPTTLTVRFFTLIHYGLRADVAVCALLLFLLSLTMAFVLFWNIDCWVKKR